MDYIEDRVRSFCVKTTLRIPLMDANSIVGSHIATPKQTVGSLDCGVIACYVIEQLIRGAKIRGPDWTP